jgi:hypothetical protein
MALILSKRAKDKWDAIAGDDLSMYDPIYFIENQLELPNSHRKFKLTGDQLHLLTALNDDKLIVCKQRRGVGVTSAMLAYALWQAQFNSNMFTLIVAPTQVHAELLRDELLRLYGTQTKSAGAAMTYYNRAEVRFDTGSRIHFSRAHANVATGYMANMVILADFSLFDSDLSMEVMKCAMPAITVDGRLLVTGHPTTTDHFFYDLWNMADTSVASIAGRRLHAVDLGGGFA